MQACDVSVRKRKNSNDCAGRIERFFVIFIIYILIAMVVSNIKKSIKGE